MEKRMGFLNSLKWVAYIEGWSYILLVFLAMPLKYFFGHPEFIRPVGMAHGVLFVIYVILLLICGVIFRWSLSKMTILFLISLIPFGTFIWKRLYTK